MITRVYIGTYSAPEARGIHTFNFDDATGVLTPLGGVSGIANPSYLALHPNGKYLYAVSEAGGGEVIALAIDEKTGDLTILNKQSARGGGPCHVSVDKRGKNALIANYGNGSIGCFPLDGDGKLGQASAFVQHVGSGKDPRRQSGPHAHCIQEDPSERFVLTSDLGLDKLLIYRYDAGRGTLTANDTPFFSLAGGAGPRHFAFHPHGRLVFIINELNSTLTSCRWDGKRGALSEVETQSTLPGGNPVSGNSTAAIRVHPKGGFVYGSNRGHDSIVTFAIDQKSGKLKALGNTPVGGKTPRDFNLDPSGRWLIAAHQDSDSLTVFRVDERSGQLSPTGQGAKVSRPVCVVFAEK
jgi:6-phosphogluconolactonase